MQKTVHISAILGHQWYVQKGHQPQRSPVIQKNLLSDEEHRFYITHRSSSLKIQSKYAIIIKKEKERCSAVNTQLMKEYFSNSYDSVNPLSIYLTDICCFLGPVTHSVKADLLCISIVSYVSCVTKHVSERNVW